MRNKIVVNKLQVGVENPNKIRINVPFHLQEPLQQLFLEKISHIIQLLAFHPTERDNFWVVYHFSTCFKVIFFNKLNVSWKLAFKMPSCSYNPSFDPFLWWRSGIHGDKIEKKKKETKTNLRCSKRCANEFFVCRKTNA